jgi:hypothetical protein
MSIVVVVDMMVKSSSDAETSIAVADTHDVLWLKHRNVARLVVAGVTRK